MTDDITRYDDVEAYADALSYAPGDTVRLHVSGRAERFDVVVERWGGERTPMVRAEGLRGVEHPTPLDADARGCGWPVAWDIPIDGSWRPGFHLVTLTAHGGADPARTVGHAGFVVRRGEGAAPAADGLLVLATNTWNAYNAWGGRSLYTGGTQVSFDRPFGRGLLVRHEVDRDDRKARPRRRGEEPDVDGAAYQAWRFAHGYAGFAGSSGWWTYERRFVEWAERAGFTFDYAVSSDLEHRPQVAHGHGTIVSVGHDEYWSAPQRDAVEGHVRRGGRFVSFSGNTMFWQVRLTDGGRTMIGHKYRAHVQDPVLGTADERTMSGMWADPIVGRPEASFLGAGSAWGLYSRYGQATARGSGAFTVYRDDHWLFAGTGLRYGDLLGADDGVVGYETVGCRLAFDDEQLPVRAGGDATPEDLEIVAFTPSSNLRNGEYPKSIAALNDQGDLDFIADRIHGGTDEASLRKVRHGNAVMVVARPFGPVAGEVVTVGTTDWVFGLADPQVARVTENALRGR